MATSVKINQPAFMPTVNATTGAQLPGMVPYTDQDYRLAFQDAVGKGSTGIITPGDLLVTASGTADMNVHVGTGRYRIQGTSSNIEGIYMGGSYSAQTLSGFAADSVKDRIDTVAVEIIYDNTGQNWYAQLVVVQGSLPSTGPPAAPTLPVNSFALANIYMTAGATTIPGTAITNVSQYALPIGTIWPWSGPPTTGSYTKGAMGFDNLMAEWVCIASGSPGTWAPSSPVRFQRVTLSGQSSGVLNIPASIQNVITKYRIRFSVKGSSGGTLVARFNNDATAGHYSYTDAMAGGTTMQVFNENGNTAGINVGELSGDSNYYGGFIEIQVSPGIMANFQYQSGGWLVGLPGPRAHTGGGVWNPAAIINSLSLWSSVGTMTGWMDVEGTP